MARKLTLLLLLCSSVAFGQRMKFRSQFIAMGSAFEVVIVADSDSADWANAMIDTAKAEIYRIEKIISSWDPNSQTSQVNSQAGIDYTMVDPELYSLIQRSCSVSAFTRGAFDITFAALADVWDFDKSQRKVWPDSSLIEEKLWLIDYKKIWLVPETQVLLSNVGMRIGFGGIGKGYTADVVSLKLRMLGVRNGVVNASGDLQAWGTDENHEVWKTAIIDPENKKKVKLWLSLTNQAIVTSGDYEKYKMHDGKRYAHIINPKTGYPTTGIKSVSVIAMKAELADAMATAIFVLGVEEGLSLINKINSVECIIIDDNNKLWYSENVEALLD